MITPKKIIACLIYLFLLSCSPNADVIEDKLTHIDLDEKPDLDAVNKFIKRISIRLLPLETTENSVFSADASSVVVNNSGIFVLDKMQNAVLVFNINGKFIHKIQRVGSGPEEYLRARSFAVSESQISILDHSRIQQYDFEANYQHTIPLVNPGQQLIMTPTGEWVVMGNYTDEYLLRIYNQSGEVTASYFPRQDKLADMLLTRSAESSMGWYDNGIYVSNYFDTTVYRVINNEVMKFMKFDFGKYNIPDDMFEGSPENKMDNFELNRKESVMCLDNLTVTDEWIIFVPEKFRDYYVIYYDRKTKTYMNNRALSFPFSVLFGRYKAPKGYTADEEFYSLIESEELEEIKNEWVIKENDPANYNKLYNEIEMIKLQEGDNPVLMLYKLN